MKSGTNRYAAPPTHPVFFRVGFIVREAACRTKVTGREDICYTEPESGVLSRRPEHPRMYDLGSKLLVLLAPRGIIGAIFVAVLFVVVFLRMLRRR